MFLRFFLMVYQGKSDFISKLAKKLKHQIPEYF